MTEDVTVNIWSGSRFSNSIGHASLSLNEDIYIGRYMYIVKRNITLKDDIEYEDGAHPENIPIYLSKDQKKKITEWRDQFNNYSKYDDLTCSTIVFQALNAAIPELNRFKDMFIWIPDDIKEIALALQRGKGKLNEKDLVELKEKFSEIVNDKVENHKPKLESWLRILHNQTTAETVTVSVNIWSGSSKSFGHASLSLNKDIHISWWPSKSDLQEKICCHAVKNQTMEDDIKREDGVEPEEIQIQLSKEQERKIAEWWDLFKNKNMYKVITLNCSTVVFRALNAAFQELHTLEDINIWIPDAINHLAKALRKGGGRLKKMDLPELKEKLSKTDQRMNQAMNIISVEEGSVLNRFFSWFNLVEQLSQISQRMKQARIKMPLEERLVSYGFFSWISYQDEDFQRILTTLKERRPLL